MLETIGLFLVLIVTGIPLFMGLLYIFSDGWNDNDF